MWRKDYCMVYRILKLKCEVIDLPVYENGRGTMHRARNKDGSDKSAPYKVKQSNKEANTMSQENLSKRIEINPRIMLGKPIIKGTRIPIEIILRKLSQNISIDKILQEYPRLTSKDIQAALEYAAESVHGEEVHLLRVAK